MGLVKVVVQFKNDIVDLKPEQYISLVQVGKWSGIRCILIPPSLPADSVLVSSAVSRGGATGPDPERG